MPLYVRVTFPEVVVALHFTTIKEYEAALWSAREFELKSLETRAAGECSPIPNTFV
jgi:hypothetical protein